MIPFKHSVFEWAWVTVVCLTVGLASLKLITDFFNVSLELDHLICTCYVLSPIAEMLHRLLLVIEKVKLVTVEVFLMLWLWLR